jgi:hypothetical protein
VISGFRRDADKICIVLSCYAARSGNTLLTFRNQLLVPSSRVEKSKKKAFFYDFLTLEDKINKLSLHDGKVLQLHAD